MLQIALEVIFSLSLSKARSHHSTPRECLDRCAAVIEWWLLCSAEFARLLVLCRQFGRSERSGEGVACNGLRVRQDSGFGSASDVLPLKAFPQPRYPT